MKCRSEYHFSTFRAVHHQSLSTPQPYLLPHPKRASPSLGVLAAALCCICCLCASIYLSASHSSFSTGAGMGTETYFCFPSGALPIAGTRGKGWERKRILFFPMSLYFSVNILEDFFNLEGATSCFQFQQQFQFALFF